MLLLNRASLQSASALLSLIYTPLVHASPLLDTEPVPPNDANIRHIQNFSMPTAAGTCTTYLTKGGDSCWAIANDRRISVEQLQNLNKRTWGWTGCEPLGTGMTICVSEGEPPFPVAVQGVQCGPQVPGTQVPSPGTDWEKMNPCPLNACCDVWGYCGTTTEFCTPSGTGNPGTALPGTNGCISNCGSEIVVGNAPSSWTSVAYFEAFNPSRKCLNMDVTSVDKQKYTHIHYAFGDITQDFQVSIDSTYDQFQKFIRMTGIKRILSFGGWTFSTDPATYMIFRNGVTPANRQKLAKNIADFVKRYSLDGVDIDWEYPGAPDIPDIPPGSQEDGPNYLAFLRLLKSMLPGKTVSIAAPASFWYLKAFPIKEMSQVVDYIIYMTYDLHGQWDYGNENAMPGCEAGNCLRSHINVTETLNALSMITKAGMPSNKIMVGVTSYGRSFKMTDPNCSGPMCTYTGEESGAKPGRCTDTAGYIANAEIDEIIQRNVTRAYHDSTSDSDVLIYNNDNWAAYMTDSTKNTRIQLYKSLNFAGVTDWAVDLQAWNVKPIPITGPEDPNIKGHIDPYLDSCNDDQKRKVLEAWQDAGKVAEAHYEWRPSDKWQPAMDLYMGPNTRYSFWNPEPRYGLDIEREYKIHYGGFWDNPIYTYAYFYCDEKVPNVADFCAQGGTFAYSWDQLGWFWSNHYVVFCPAFFDSPSLRETENAANGKPWIQSDMNEWYETRADTVMHETYHWGNTVSNPRCDLDPEIYMPQDVVDLAKNRPSDTLINAESFTQAATAIYIQETFGLADPPTPNGRRAPRNNRKLAKVPDTWVGPVPIDSPTFSPQGANIVKLSSIGPLSIKKKVCHAGVYNDGQQCVAFCYDGQCITDPDKNNKQETCKCSGQTCKNGVYKNFDECNNNCFRGLCIESAGQPGVTCRDCP